MAGRGRGLKKYDCPQWPLKYMYNDRKWTNLSATRKHGDVVTRLAVNSMYMMRNNPRTQETNAYSNFIIENTYKIGTRESEIFVRIESRIESASTIRIQISNRIGV